MWVNINLLTNSSLVLGIINWPRFLNIVISVKLSSFVPGNLKVWRLLINHQSCHGWDWTMRCCYVLPYSFGRIFCYGARLWTSANMVALRFSIVAAANIAWVREGEPGGFKLLRPNVQECSLRSSCINTCEMFGLWWHWITICVLAMRMNCFGMSIVSNKLSRCFNMRAIYHCNLLIQNLHAHSYNRSMGKLYCHWGCHICISEYPCTMLIHHSLSSREKPSIDWEAAWKAKTRQAWHWLLYKERLSGTEYHWRNKQCLHYNK